MLLTTRSLLIASIASTIVASPVSLSKKGVSIRRRQAQNGGNGKAAYVITNDEQQNAVAAISINADGTLGDATVTATGGSGSIAVDADGKPAVPDALVGQSALTIAGNVCAIHISPEALEPNLPPAHLCSKCRLEHRVHARHIPR